MPLLIALTVTEKNICCANKYLPFEVVFNSFKNHESRKLSFMKPRNSGQGGACEPVFLFIYLVIFYQRCLIVLKLEMTLKRGFDKDTELL